MEIHDPCLGLLGLFLPNLGSKVLFLDSGQPFQAFKGFFAILTGFLVITSLFVVTYSECVTGNADLAP